VGLAVPGTDDLQYDRRFLIARKIDPERGDPNRRKWAHRLAGFEFSVLGTFKYFNFFGGFLLRRRWTRWDSTTFRCR